MAGKWVVVSVQREKSRTWEAVQVGNGEGIEKCRIRHWRIDAGRYPPGVAGRWQLGIETSTGGGTVALARDGEVMVEATAPSGGNPSAKIQSL